MIIHVFNDRMNFSQKLSSKISGMYPVYIEDEMAANVIAKNNQWEIKLSDKFTSREIAFGGSKLVPYKIYTVVSNFNGESYRLIATPRYDEKIASYDMVTELTVGSDRNCDVYYPLGFSKMEFLKITRANGKWLAETNSTNFFASGERVATGREIMNGDYIFFYGLKLIIVGARVLIDNPNNAVQIKSKLQPTKPEKLQPPVEVEGTRIKEDLPLYTEADYFYKSPRFNYKIETATVGVDEPPAPEKGDGVPAFFTIGPQVTMAGVSVVSMVGLVMSLSSGESDGWMIGLSIGTMALSLVGTIMWPILIEKYNKHRLKKREKKRQKKYAKYLDYKRRLLEFIKANQKQTLLENHPTPHRCTRIIETKSKELWQRDTGHSDFLTVRLGAGEVETKLNVNLPMERFSLEDDDNLFLEMKKVVEDSLTIKDAPVTYDFTKHNIDAIVSDDDSVKKFMDDLFLQILTFHAYTELKIVVFTKDPERWEYLKMVPHCWDNQKTTRYFATSVEKLSTISAELEKVFNARAANSEEVKLEDDGSQRGSETTYKDFRPYYLFFIDDMAAVRKVPLINKILYYKRNLGFSIIATTQSLSMLPSEAANFIFVSKRYSSIMSGEAGTTEKEFAADFNNGEIDMYGCAQKMANIPVQAEKGRFELPSTLSFLELYERGRVEQLNSLDRWSSNNPTNSLAVPIGIDQNNETLQMDIHEKAFGPHGLVAGTTGSGKSEWIVTYILSLAVNFNPDEVQFVLIDYKGGGLAKSFENSELGIKLPHLAGTITNLDKSEIFRSISAIESELKRRQAVFNAAREKLLEGSMDIYKYQEYYRKGLVDEPMSHLLIICDEFAELRQQEPDFMDQLISTSRIGRSLGVHLILATQKPSGVVNDQIWSNSKFKVCLKVQDKGDSNEVLRRPDAAFLKQAGTFYIQVGNDDYFNLAQSAWAGSKYYPSDVVKHKIDNSIQCIDDIGQVTDYLREETKKKENQGEELLNIVAYLSEISKQVKLVCRPMWLKNIPAEIMLAEVRKKYQVKPGAKYTYNTLIGEYDEPRRQEQGALSIDLAEGNVAIIGKADTSIEKLISTIVWSSVCERTPAEIAYYMIDFGTETLKKFAKFPQVGEVIFQDEIDKVAGVLTLIQDEMSRRKEILSDYNGSFEYYNRVAKNKMHLIVAVINGYDVFVEALPRAEDLLAEMFRDAPKYGIVFVVGANTTNALGYHVLQFFNHVIPMQMTDDDQYQNITDCRRGLIPKKVVGRGICKLDAGDNDSYCEFQTAMIAPEDKELEVIKAYANRCVEYYKCKVKQLTKIPDDATSDDVVRYITDLQHVPIGVNVYEKDVATYDFLSQKVHLFTSKNLQENMSFIYGLVAVLSKTPNVKVRVIDMLGMFQKPILDIKLFNDGAEMDAVFEALENDVATRTEAQDCGVNLLIGAGGYKNALGEEGLESFKKVFAGLPKSKKSVYVLIDNYDQLRGLKLEEWFGMVNTGTGMWLGPGLDSQSLFECGEMTGEDKKFSYNGLAFNIKDKEYKVVKTIMDEDV